MDYILNENTMNKFEEFNSLKGKGDYSDVFKNYFKEISFEAIEDFDKDRLILSLSKHLSISFSIIILMDIIYKQQELLF